MSHPLFKGAILSTAIVAGIVSGCSSDDDDMTGGVDSGSIANAGLVVVDSARPVGEAMGALQTALASNEAITALPLIDHAANAASIEETLRPTAVQLFGNPALGTPLMQVNQLAGLDLPQKVLAWEDAEGATHLEYNSADYLQQRHAIVGNEAALLALENIGNALNNLVTNASGNTADDAAADESETDADATPAVSVDAGEGIITVTSTRDMDTTYNALLSSIESSEALSLVAELDHAANAQNVELELDPTRLIIFGNPSAGTPLMQDMQSVGIDLPQKMLVFENAEGVVTIAYNDPAYLAERHGITGQEVRLTTIRGALAALAANAGGMVTAE